MQEVDVNRQIQEMVQEGIPEKMPAKDSPVIFAISGYKNSGKTTLTVKLVSRLTAMGYRVATIKHDGHDFEPDVPGTDSYRHRQAGACGTAVFSDHRFMVTRDQPKASEEKIDETILIQMFPDVDIILLEGFKHSSWPKYFCRYPEEVPDEKEALQQIIKLLDEKNQLACLTSEL